MIVRINKAFLIKKQDFLNTSLICNFLTEDGKVKGIIKGAKRNKKSIVINNIDYSYEYNLEYTKKETGSELKNFYNVNLINNFSVQNKFIYYYFFLNELLDKFLLEGINSKDLVQSYQDFLKTNSIQNYLKTIFTLFETLGFGINFEENIENNEPILSNKKYHFDGYGFISYREQDNFFWGEDIFQMKEYISIEHSLKLIKIFINKHSKFKFKTLYFL